MKKEPMIHAIRNVHFSSCRDKKSMIVPKPNPPIQRVEKINLKTKVKSVDDMVLLTIFELITKKSAGALAIGCIVWLHTTNRLF